MTDSDEKGMVEEISEMGVFFGVILLALALVLIIGYGLLFLWEQKGWLFLYGTIGSAGLMVLIISVSINKYVKHWR